MTNQNSLLLLYTLEPVNLSSEVDNIVVNCWVF